MLKHLSLSFAGLKALGGQCAGAEQPITTLFAGGGINKIKAEPCLFVTQIVLLKQTVRVDSDCCFAVLAVAAWSLLSFAEA